MESVPSDRTSSALGVSVTTCWLYMSPRMSGMANPKSRQTLVVVLAARVAVKVEMVATEVKGETDLYRRLS